MGLKKGSKWVSVTGGEAEGGGIVGMQGKPKRTVRWRPGPAIPDWIDPTSILQPRRLAGEGIVVDKITAHVARTEKDPTDVTPNALQIRTILARSASHAQLCRVGKLCRPAAGSPRL